MCNDRERVEAIKTAKRRYRASKSYTQIADELGVTPTDIWRAVQHDYASPKLIKAMKIKIPRPRICADVTEAQREALHALAASHNMSWSEYCRMLAQNEPHKGEG